jgi:RNA-binding protein NOB1
LNGAAPGAQNTATSDPVADESKDVATAPEVPQEVIADAPVTEPTGDEQAAAVEESKNLEAELETLSIQPTTVDAVEASQPTTTDAVEASEDAEEGDEEAEDDGDGEWITPSNIKKHKAKENITTTPEPIQRVLQAALLTTDMAMRNVALRINLNLLDPSCQRITHIKTWVLRCHGCFKICKNMTRQFCPNCGQATLTRVSCSTDASGAFQVHLKKNFQWNTRGNVYSIPKPTHGSASGKVAATSKGGGKNGWGRELILAEDQREYTRKVEENQRSKYKDLMDEDYLPGILTGERKGASGKIRVGAGRTVNSRKR